MNILVTGGSGYIGSMIIPFLKCRHEVYNYDILHGNDYRKIPLVSLENIDVVIHLAAIVGAEACSYDPLGAISTNYKSLPEFLNKCDFQNIKLFIFASTCSVYGKHYDLCKEKTQLNPLSLYARSKAMAEEIINKHPINSVIFRFGTVFGVSKEMRWDLLINKFVHDAVYHREINVYNGLNYRPFVHVRDIALAMSKIIDTPIEEVNKQIFNLVSENTTILDLANTVKDCVHCSVYSDYKKNIDQRSYSASNSKLDHFIDFKPNITILDGIYEVMCNCI